MYGNDIGVIHLCQGLGFGAKSLGALRITQKGFVDDFDGDNTTAEIKITPDADKRLAKLINGKADDEINLYYTLMNTVHGKGSTKKENGL